MSSTTTTTTTGSAQQQQQLQQTNHLSNNNNNSITSINGLAQVDRPTGATWRVQASWAATNTCNPIREIIESLDLAENPDKKLIPLSIGDPTIFGNLKPCPEILDSIHKSIASGQYLGYQVAAGMDGARDAVAAEHFRSTGNPVKRQDVILTSGCSHAIDLSICVLARQGQNILIPRPGFPLYKTLTSVYGIHYKQYNLLAEESWAVDLKHLESLIDENTAAIVINNPSNPCGSVFSREHLLQILELAERYRKPIIADEIYDKFVFTESVYRQHLASKSLRQQAANNGTGVRSNSIPLNGQLNMVTALQSVDQSLDDLENLNTDEQPAVNSYPKYTNNHYHRHEQPVFTAISALSETVPILTCGGISKTCLIPGIRLGWIIINDRKHIFEPSIRSGLNRLAQRLMGPNSLVQGALADILNKVPDSFYSQTMTFILKNAELCYERLCLVSGLRPYMPQGSMYLMVRFDADSFPSLNGDLEFTSKLMNEESVLVLPGKCFDFPNFFRICLTVPRKVMEEALDRIQSFCERHYRTPIKHQTPVGHLHLTRATKKPYASVSATKQTEKPATATAVQPLLKLLPANGAGQRALL